MTTAERARRFRLKHRPQKPTYLMLVRELARAKAQIAVLEAELARAERKLAKAKLEMTATIPQGTT
jgi:hypothetical protein